MAGGFGEAAAAVSFISLTIQLFDGCVKGFTLLSNAQGLGSQAEVLVCQLEWEHYRLSQWARMVGLHNSAPELIIANLADAHLIQKTLGSLQRLLLDTDTLSREYGLNLAVTDEELGELPEPSKHFLGKVIGRTKPQLWSDTAKVYQRRNNAWKKLKWSSVDAAKFRVLLKDIRYFNKQLEGVLHAVDRSRNLRLHDQLMRTIVSQTSDRRVIDAISGSIENSAVDGVIASSAKLRQKGLTLDLIESPESTHHHGIYTRPSTATTAVIQASKAMRKDISRISCHGHRKPDIFREMGTLDSKTVLLEWKDVPPHLDSKLKYRISNLASFLADMRDEAFHSLTCVGYVRASTPYSSSSPPLDKGSRYAYIFEPPRTIQATDRLNTMENLLQCNLQGHRREGSCLHSCPGINARITIALSLAETLLQLHTMGWLHKAIRPDNILFFQRSHGPEDGLDGQHWAPYLSGYTSARADTPLETTEDPSEVSLAQLYRHPLSLGHGRTSYRQAFDRHSLGCVLIEVGLWTSLPDLLRARLVSLGAAEVNSRHSPFSSLSSLSSCTTITTDKVEIEKAQLLAQKSVLLSGDHEQEAGDSVLAQLEHVMGTTYAKLVKRCLHDDGRGLGGHASSTAASVFHKDKEGEKNGMDEDNEEEDPILETDRSLQMQQWIVDTLRELNGVL